MAFQKLLSKFAKKYEKLDEAAETSNKLDSMKLKSGNCSTCSKCSPTTRIYAMKNCKHAYCQQCAEEFIPDDR